MSAVYQSLHRVIASTMLPLASNPAVDVANLVTALGGNASVAAIYDCRTGLTTVQNGSNTNVTTWADARGGGFGPNLTQGTTAKQPTIAADGSLSFSQPANQNLISATNALFNIGGTYSLIGIGQIPGSQSLTMYLCAIGDAANEFLGVTQLGSSNLWGVKGGKTVVQQQTNTSSLPAMHRVISATLISTVSLGVQVPRQGGITTQVISVANTSANAALCVGGFNGASGNMTGLLRAVICLPTAASVSTVSNIVFPWAQQYHNAQSS